GGVSGDGRRRSSPGRGKFPGGDVGSAVRAVRRETAPARGDHQPRGHTRGRPCYCAPGGRHLLHTAGPGARPAESGPDTGMVLVRLSSRTCASPPFTRAAFGPTALSRPPTGHAPARRLPPSTHRLGLFSVDAGASAEAPLGEKSLQ